jgi:hypothetical protein
MNLDPFAAILTGWAAICLFLLYHFSNPRHDRWMNMPGYVRRGLAATGGLFMWRSVNFLTIPPADISPVGHINPEGFIALIALTYTVTALAIWSGVFKRLPVRGWSRIHWAERQVRQGRAPVMLDPEQLVELAKSEGVTVNATPPPRPSTQREPLP